MISSAPLVPDASVPAILYTLHSYIEVWPSTHSNGLPRSRYGVSMRGKLQKVGLVFFGLFGLGTLAGALLVAAGVLGFLDNPLASLIMG